MATAIQTELRLIAVIKEAKDLLVKLNQKRQSIEGKAALLEKGNPGRKSKIEELNEVTFCIRNLKECIKEANIVIAGIEKHNTWVFTVLNVFGQEGLDKCFEHIRMRQKKVAEDQMQGVEA